MSEGSKDGGHPSSRYEVATRSSDPNAQGGTEQLSQTTSPPPSPISNKISTKPPTSQKVTSNPLNLSNEMKNNTDDSEEEGLYHGLPSPKQSKRTFRDKSNTKLMQQTIATWAGGGRGKKFGRGGVSRGRGLQRSSSDKASNEGEDSALSRTNKDRGTGRGRSKNIKPKDVRDHSPTGSVQESRSRSRSRSSERGPSLSEDTEDSSDSHHSTSEASSEESEGTPKANNDNQEQLKRRAKDIARKEREGNSASELQSIDDGALSINSTELAGLTQADT